MGESFYRSRILYETKKYANKPDFRLTIYMPVVSAANICKDFGPRFSPRLQSPSQCVIVHYKVQLEFQNYLPDPPPSQLVKTYDRLLPMCFSFEVTVYRFHVKRAA